MADIEPILSLLDEAVDEFDHDVESFGFDHAFTSLVSVVAGVGDSEGVDRLRHLAKSSIEKNELDPPLVKRKVGSIINTSKRRLQIKNEQKTTTDEEEQSKRAEAVVWGRLHDRFWRSPFVLILAGLLIVTIAVAVGGSISIWGTSFDIKNDTAEQVRQLETARKEAENEIAKKRGEIAVQVNAFRKQVNIQAKEIRDDAINAALKEIRTYSALIQAQLETERNRQVAHIGRLASDIQQEVRGLAESLRTMERRTANATHSVEKNEASVSKSEKEVNGAAERTATAAQRVRALADNLERSAREAGAAASAAKDASSTTVDASASALGAASEARSAAEAGRQAQVEVARAEADVKAVRDRVAEQEQLISTVAEDARRAKETISAGSAEVRRAKITAEIAASKSSDSEKIAKSAESEITRVKEKVVVLGDVVATAKLQSDSALRSITDSREAAGLAATLADHYKEAAGSAAQDAVNFANRARISARELAPPVAQSGFDDEQGTPSRLPKEGAVDRSTAPERAATDPEVGRSSPPAGRER